MVETWEPLRDVPRVDHVRRTPMDALDVEMRSAAGEQALQALMKFAREHAGTLEAHAAEKGLFTRLLAMGLAAMQRYVAERGTGDVGAAITRSDGVLRTREKPLRGRDDFSRFGKFAGARTCYRTAGEPGIFPLDAPVNRPARGSSYFLHEWLTGCAVEPPCKESAGCFAPLFALEVAESVLMEGAQEVPEDEEGFYAQPPGPREATTGALLVVSVDGTGVPRLKAAAVTLTATWGTGEKRQQKTAALVGVSSTLEAKPRWPEARAALLVAPQAARARRRREDTRDEAPRAQQVRRLASLVRTKPQVLERIKADAERRDPPHRQPLVVVLDGALCVWHLAPTLCTEWRRRTCVLDIMHVVGSLWSAANAWFGAGTKDGTRWVQAKLRDLLRGRVGDVIGGLRQSLTKRRRRKSGRETRAKVITCFHNHRRWRPYEAYLAAGLPVGTGVVESACGSVVKHRMAGEGQRWSLVGAEVMLALRSRKKSHDHDLRDYWQCHARQVRVRLYGGKPQYTPTPWLRHAA